MFVLHVFLVHLGNPHLQPSSPGLRSCPPPLVAELAGGPEPVARVRSPPSVVPTSVASEACDVRDALVLARVCVLACAFSPARSAEPVGRREDDSIDI